MRSVPAAAPRTDPGLLRRLPAELAPHRRAVARLAPLVAAWAVWASGPSWAAPAFVVVAVAGAALGVVDARTHRLPDAVTLPATVAVALLLGLAAVADGDAGRCARAAAGAVVLGVAYLLLHLVNRRGLGLGDVKLAVLLGLPAGWAGWDVVWWAGVLPFLLGGLAALALVLARRASRHTALAFGPWMLAGAAAALSLARVAG
jgi:leader peptidase (prepilin peptidase)/N-methyltransferase